jgi:hypothetical protein
VVLSGETRVRCAVHRCETSTVAGVVGVGSIISHSISIVSFMRGLESGVEFRVVVHGAKIVKVNAPRRQKNTAKVIKVKS